MQRKRGQLLEVAETPYFIHNIMVWAINLKIYRGRGDFSLMKYIIYRKDYI